MKNSTKERLDNAIRFRVTSTMKGDFSRKAKNRGLSISDYIKELMRRDKREPIA